MASSRSTLEAPSPCPRTHSLPEQEVGRLDFPGMVSSGLCLEKICSEQRSSLRLVRSGCLPIGMAEAGVLQRLSSVLEPWCTCNPQLLSIFQFSSVAQSCPILCDPMDCSTPGFPVLHRLSEFTQTHVHQVGDAIQPSHPLSPSSPPAFNLSQHRGLFQ